MSQKNAFFARKYTEFAKKMRAAAFFNYRAEEGEREKVPPWPQLHHFIAEMTNNINLLWVLTVPQDSTHFVNILFSWGQSSNFCLKEMSKKVCPE